ncbi:LysE family translocator [Acidisoma sp. 7E03]
MIDLPLLLAFIAAATLLTVTPGVDTAIVLRSAASGGPRAGAAAALGVGLGCLAWGAAVSVGLGALLRASPWLYDALRYLGAAYLLWLGGRLLLRPRGAFTMEASQAGQAGAFRRGLVTNLLNPKVGVFYVTFLPQFIPAHADVAAYSFTLAAVHVGLSILWFALLIGATVPLLRLLRRPVVIRRLDQLTGCVLLAFGLRLAVVR